LQKNNIMEIRTEVFYYDKDDNPCTEDQAYRMSIVVYDENDNVVPDLCCTALVSNSVCKV